MNFQCPKCLWIHQLDPGDHRLPPWCKRCGIDLKPDEYRPVTQPASDPPWVPPRSSGEDEITQVTGTGGKPWLNSTKPEPASEPIPLAVATSLQDRPSPAPDADENLVWVVLGMKVVGGALLGIALLLAGEVWMFAKNGQTVNGRVVTEWRADPLAFAMYYRDMVIKYEVNGANYELPVGRREEGDLVELIYPPAHPQKARINTRGSLYQWPLLLGAAGLMLLLSGLAIGASLAYDNRAKTTPAASEDTVA